MLSLRHKKPLFLILLVGGFVFVAAFFTAPSVNAEDDFVSPRSGNASFNNGSECLNRLSTYSYALNGNAITVTKTGRDGSSCGTTQATSQRAAGTYTYHIADTYSSGPGQTQDFTCSVTIALLNNSGEAYVTAEKTTAVNQTRADCAKMAPASGDVRVSLASLSVEELEALEVSTATQKALDDPCSGLGEEKGGRAVRWMVCPAAQGGNQLTSFLDDLVASVLRYDTTDINEDNSMTRAMWSVFRNIALGLLVIVGLVMIIAQAAGAQILDAYTIRKAIPRLLIAVVGIALSWPMMVFTVELFNDLGGMMQNIILAPVGGAVKLGEFSATGIVEGLLAGQPITVGTVSIATATGIGVALGWAGVSSLLLVALLSLAIVALLLALRWVVITICLVAAPIAIVAYVLPNTEKIWKFWSSTFIGALATFPVVMAVLALGKAAAVMVLSIG